MLRTEFRPFITSIAALCQCCRPIKARYPAFNPAIDKRNCYHLIKNIWSNYLSILSVQGRIESGNTRYCSHLPKLKTHKHLRLLSKNDVCMVFKIIHFQSTCPFTAITNYYQNGHLFSLMQRLKGKGIVFYFKWESKFECKAISGKKYAMLVAIRNGRLGMEIAIQLIGSKLEMTANFMQVN